MTDSVTHVAGPLVAVKGRIVQRCPVCGEKLSDNRDSKSFASVHAGPAPEFAAWTEGALVQFQGARQSVVGDFFQEGPLPNDFCLELVE